MTGTDTVLMTLVFVLGGVFGIASLAAYLIRKIIDAVKARRRQRRIDHMFKHLPLVQDRPEESPRHPRVLYAPKHDPEREPEHEADTILPIFAGWDLAKGPDYTVITPKVEPEPFVGKGGASGGAGASGDWDAPASETPKPLAETPAEPEPVAVLETSETQIDAPEAPSES